MRLPLLIIGLSLSACKGTLPPYVAPEDVDTQDVQDADTDTDPPAEQHAARFAGLWAVDQPFHAAYELTHYEFVADGTLVAGTTWPSDCTGHTVNPYCVTGSVSDCVAGATETWCEPQRTCVFGDSWHSEDDETLVIEGDCSDDITRSIVLHFGSESRHDPYFGITPVLTSVDGETGWSHNGWDWAFRKCPTDEECGLLQ